MSPSTSALSFGSNKTEKIAEDEKAKGSQAQRSELLRHREVTCSKLNQRPYSVGLYLLRARLHAELEYPDLAAGDAYRALSLSEELSSDGEHADMVRGAIEDEAVDLPSDMELVHSLNCKFAETAFELLTRALFLCKDFRGVSEICHRALRRFPSNKDILAIKSQIPATTERYGKARREIYPWNDHEPNRSSAESLTVLNDEMAEISTNCEVRVVELPRLDQDKKDGDTIKQLGVFATRDIEPGTSVLQEPSILSANNRTVGDLCETCSANLHVNKETWSCGDCETGIYCSEACRDRALASFHPAICEYESFDSLYRNPDPADATDSLYTLLCGKVIAMTVTQNTHPLDLLHVKYLWGDFLPSQSLPFSFQTNIAQPLHMLNQLDIDLYSPQSVDRYDTWVFNTIFAKLRGVASAKMSKYSKCPDVATVHPLWCLANHSCAPNVRWEWAAEEDDFRGRQLGALGLTARTDTEMVQWGDHVRLGGIKEGQEILNHYCDVGMDVQQRREWAAGALGGTCVCERCVWEENSGQQGQKAPISKV